MQEERQSRRETRIVLEEMDTDVSVKRGENSRSFALI